VSAPISKPLLRHTRSSENVVQQSTPPPPPPLPPPTVNPITTATSTPISAAVAPLSAVAALDSTNISTTSQESASSENDSITRSGTKRKSEPATEAASEIVVVHEKKTCRRLEVGDGASSTGHAITTSSPSPSAVASLSSSATAATLSSSSSSSAIYCHLHRNPIPSKDNPPPGFCQWLHTFQYWSNAERLLAIDQLIELCEPTQVRHMMAVIEPQFQRDFISLLPKELALYVLSFLTPRDLTRAAQTCLLASSS